MAKHDFYDPIDLHQKELLNVRLQALLNLPPDPFEGQICYHSISSKKLGALYDGTEWRYFGLPPLGKSYESQALMLADQVNQLPDYAYFDGLKEWRKLGTSTGVIADYREIGGGTSIHNDLEGIQGGIEGERYHVNKNVNDALEAGTSPATANPFVTVSALNSYAYVQESPNDGKAYVRKSNVWAQLSPFDLKQEGATDGQALVWSVANSRYQPGTVGGGGGGSSLWEQGTAFIYRIDSVQIGRSTKANPNSKLAVNSDQAGGPGKKYIEFLNHDSTVEHFSINQYGQLRTSDRTSVFGGATINLANQGFTFKGNGSNGVGNVFRILSATDVVLFEINSNLAGAFNLRQTNLNVGSPTVNLALDGSTFKGKGNNGVNSVFSVNNSLDAKLFEIYSNASGGNGVVIHSHSLKVGSPTVNLALDGSTFKGSDSTLNTRMIFTVLNSNEGIALNITGARNIITPGIYNQTNDPLIQGMLWNDGGTIKISAG